jgi:hypothetical protein
MSLNDFKDEFVPNSRSLIDKSSFQDILEKRRFDLLPPSPLSNSIQASSLIEQEKYDEAFPLLQGKSRVCNYLRM